LGVIPLFISMTVNESTQQRDKTINVVAFGVGTILLVALFFGGSLLEFFGITIDAFQVGGRILILLVAVAMLHAKTSNIQQTDEEAHESIVKESVAIVALATPLLAGPGAISSSDTGGAQVNRRYDYMIIAGGILLLILLVWCALRWSPWVAARISATGINIFTRIMGLILMAIAVEFIAAGMKGLFSKAGLSRILPIPG
jgi:multiple antibiotic resistance protein